MKTQSSETYILGIEKLVLVGITFIRDYLQFLFDGPLLNVYTMPVVVFQGKTIHINENGYYDILCSLIGKEIISAYEDKKTEKLKLLFDNEVEVCISLKLEDRESVEAAGLRMEPGGSWKIW